MNGSDTGYPERLLMTPEEREGTERRLIEINRRLGFISSPETRDEVVPELDVEEINVLFEERDQLLKELDEDAD